MYEHLNKTIRESSILTTSYVACELVEDLSGYNQLSLAVDFTKGSLTSAQIKLEYFVAGKWAQEVASAVSSGISTDTLLEHTITATGVYNLLIPIKCSKIRVSAKGTGTVTDSLMAVSTVVAQV